MKHRPENVGTVAEVTPHRQPSRIPFAAGGITLAASAYGLQTATTAPGIFAGYLCVALTAAYLALRAYGWGHKDKSRVEPRQSGKGHRP